MTTNDLPPVPQTGVPPLALPPDQEQRLLARRRKDDQADPFASDPDDEIRRLGRLALRRDVPHAHDYLALGDLCARRSLVEGEGRLLVFYAGKALYAYRHAAELVAPGSSERDLAHLAYDAYVGWLLQVARAAPTRRNIAVALWAVAEADSQGRADGLRDEARVLALWYVSPPSGDSTPLPDPTPPPHEDHATAIYPEELVTHAGESLEVGSALLSLVAPEHEAAINETRSDKSEVFRLELEATAASPASLDVLVPPARHREGADFDFGDRIDGRYEVAQVLRGGMGIVYLCYDHEDRQSVAIKTFQSRLLTNETAVARFTQEARTWIMLEKHRHIVQARRVQKFEGRPHIILEHITGPEGLGSDLCSWIRHNRIDLCQALDFALQIALGMQHATRRVPGLVHRDLKPANILVRHDGIAKVTDFGLVRSIEAEQAAETDGDEEQVVAGLTRVGAVVGTPPYMSPEQCRAKAVDPRSDIYAFGCVLFEMLTGRVVFDAKLFTEWVHAHLNLAPAFPESAAGVPPAVKDLTLACLAKDPAARPQIWGEVVAALAALIEEATGAPPDYDQDGPELEVRELMDKGYSLTELGFAEEALVAYERVLEIEPGSAWAWARKGRTLRLLARYDEALDAYDRALELNPRFAWAWTGKGQVLERLGNLERALAAHQTATGLQPGNVWAWYNQAEVLYTRHDYDGAMEVLDRALAIDPHHAESWAKRGQVLRALDRYPEALNAYNRALELNPPYAWAWNGKGLALKALGRLPEALEAFEQAARHQPSEVWHWYNQAEMLVEMGRYAEALVPTQQATRVAPGHAYSWAKLGQVLRYLDRYPEALAAYDQALTLKPDYAWAVNGKGIVLERLGRYDEALAMYHRAAEIAPGDVWHWYNQGNLLILQNRFAEAIPLLERATQISPDHARSWARLGNACRQADRPREALKLLARAVELEPDYGWAWNERGVTLEMLGRHEEAVDAYQRAADTEPDNPLYWYNK
ncbi:MAG: tetratricopeptide repeat protein, partial [Chloroflexota bacterium]